MKRWIALWLVVLLCLTACGAQRTAEEPQKATEEVEAEAPEAEPVEAEKIEITLGGLAFDNSLLRQFVNQFNKTPSPYCVKLVDYRNKAEDALQAQQVLQTEILAGKSPDMICFDSGSREQEIDGISPLPLIAKGLLVDMDSLIIKDSKTDEQKIAIWDALHEYGGMYLMAPLFTIKTVYCAPSTLEEHQGWTVQEYLQMEDALEPDQIMMYYMSPDEFLTQIGGRYMRNALDLEHASCNFDCEEFIGILNAACQVKSYDTAKQDSADLNANDGSFRSVPERMLDGSLIACAVELRSPWDVSFDRYRSGGTPMAYIGWPTPDGSYGSDINLVFPIGISAQTEYAEGCWEFISYILRNAIVLDAFSGSPSYLPRRMQALEAANEQGSKWKTEEPDLEQMYALAASCQNLAYYDEAILNIILEEAGVMFEGNATAEEVAQRVQDRASLYMMEQYG